MENIKNNKLALALMVGLLAIAGVIYIQAEKSIKTQAIDGCLKLVQVDRKAENGDIVSIPEDYWYKFCMDKKGYSTAENKDK